MSDKILYLGNDINTDDIIPAKHGTNIDPEYLKNHALEYLIGIGKLLEYDMIEAGSNFGCGSSREIAPIAIKAAGIKKVKALSFAEIFYRNSINIGLPLEIINQPQQDPIETAIINAGGLVPFNQKRQQQLVTIPKSATSPRPMTMAEKMLAKASDNSYVTPGEIVFAKVDLAMSHDAVASSVAEVFYRSFGENAQICDPHKVVFVADHFIQINDIRSDPKAPQVYQQMIAFAQQQGCHLLDVISPGEAAGICHILLPEKGFIRPGIIVAGTDSHTCTYGALGCFSTGVGTTDMANIFALGDMWIRVPKTILINLSGTLPAGICAKDIMLFIIGKIGCNGATGKAIEFQGSIIDHLSIDERLTLANMAIECGAICGLIKPDRLTYEYLTSRCQQTFEPLTADPDATYDHIYHWDLTHLEAQIACPPKPDQVVGITQLKDIPITKAFIGSCTGGKLFDLAQAAEILKDRHISPQVKLYIVPASAEIRASAETLGYLDILEKAGGIILKSACGACINAGIGVLDPKETGIYATNRNFKGRSGDPTGKIYLASPRIVAISAILGKISDQI